MSAPRYATTKWSGITNYECLHCPVKTTDRGRIRRHVRKVHPTDAELGGEVQDSLEGVPFASTRAAEVAREEGLESEDFTGHTPTGESGGFTTDGVRHVASSATEE